MPGRSLLRTFRGLCGQIEGGVHVVPAVKLKRVAITGPGSNCSEVGATFV